VVQIPAIREFSFLQNVHTPFGAHRSPFRRGIASGRDVERSPSSVAVVKNGWSYTFTTLIRVHGVDKDNFTFYFDVLSK